MTTIPPPPGISDCIAAVEAALVADGRGLPAVISLVDDPVVLTLACGAAGAIASKFLAVGTPRSIGLVGCGPRAAALLTAHRAIFPAPRDVRCADSDPALAARFAAAHGGRVTTIEEACACDIVCTTTDARAPIVRAAWVRRGTHINAMGAGGDDRHELELELLRTAKLVVGDRGETRRAGELRAAWAVNAIHQSQLWATLGEICAGIVDGRELDEITIYDGGASALAAAAVARLA